MNLADWTRTKIGAFRQTYEGENPAVNKISRDFSKLKLFQTTLCWSDFKQ
jgi:hypothetical protein